jgi:protein-disulfide isomerase
MKTIICCLIAMAPLFGADSNGATTSRELGEAILNELRQIHELLDKQQQQARPQAQPPIETARISAAGFSMGREDAPLTLVEFADYQCPFCRQFHSSVYQRLKKDFIDTGKLRFISRDLPLDMHSNALAAAEASRCAGDQQKFWEMRDTLISHADKLEPASISTYAQELGVDTGRFQACMAEGKYTAAIRADVAEAAGAGILGTPAFVLGKPSSDGFEGVKLTGAQPYEVFRKAILEQLAR